MLGVLTMQPASANRAKCLLLAMAVLAAVACGDRGQGGGVCAGCPVEQDSGEYEGLGRKAFEVLKQVNGALIQGNFLSVSDVKTQVVAGTFFTFKVHSTLDEVCSVKLFQALPDANRVVKYEVSFASLESSPLHGEAHGDLVIAPETAGEEGEQASADLETRGASWTIDVGKDGVY